MTALFRFAAVTFWLILALAGPVLAQGAPAGAEGSATTGAEALPPSPNDVKELMRLLGDERIVGWLKRNAVAAPGGLAEGTMAEGPTIRQQAMQALARMRERIGLLRTVGANFTNAPDILIERWREELSAAETVRSITYMVIFLIIGAGLEWLYRQYTAGTRLRLELARPDSLRRQVLTALVRALIVLVGLAVFALGSIGAFLSFAWPGFVAIIVVNLLIAVVAVRSIMTVSLFVLAPRVAELRLVPLSNRLARQTSFYIALVVAVFALALAASDTFARLAATGEMTDEVRSAAFSVSIVAGLACLAAGIFAVWRMAGHARAALAAAGRLDRRVRRLVSVWRACLTGLSIVAFLLWAIAAPELMWTVLILGLLPAAFAITSAWIDHFFDQAEAFHAVDSAETQAETTGEASAGNGTAGEEGGETAEDDPLAFVHRYDTPRIMTRRFARFVLIIGAILAVLPAWGTGFFDLKASAGMAGWISSVAIDVVVALLIADLIWTWAKTAIDRRLAGYKPPVGGQAPGPEARMATLLPLLRMMLLAALVVIVGLSILSSLGVNIAPLLAGAGIAGVAIGFGTQALVRDIVSGIFFLIDDAFRVGEYIEIGNLRGVVEAMSVRSLRVRHHRGAIHTIPFGELKSLTNYSRDWVIMKMEFRVPFETDMKLVKKLLKKIGAEMLEDPLYKDSFIEPLKSQGVRRMEEFNMVIGVKFMAKPGEQWVIRRDAYHKIVAAFEANGIRLAERNVKVEVIADRPLTPAEKEAVAGAAQQAAEARVGPPGAVPDEP